MYNSLAQTIIWLAAGGAILMFLRRRRARRAR